MIDSWKSNINKFIELSNQFEVRMIMVGGGAVNFHGYQRHSADVDFWIDITNENLKKLVSVFKTMGYDIEDFPEDVKLKKQNISIKFSPVDIDLELITNFSSTIEFDEAFNNSEEAIINKEVILKWRVLSLDDLISSKLKAQRPKDLLDVQQLKKINNIE